MTTAKERTMKLQGKTSKVNGEKRTPLAVTLLGHYVVLDPFSLTIAEKQKWRGYLKDLGEHADEADHMMALAVVIIQREDPLTWDEAKDRITWQVMLDAVAAASDADGTHPEG